MKNYLFIAFIFLLFTNELFAQSYNDGPIQLRSKLREVNITYNSSDQGAFGVGFIPDEITFKIEGRDNADLDGNGWLGLSCLQDNYNPPGLSSDFNYEFFNHTYTGANVPQFLDIKVEAWQDNCGSDGAAGFNCSGTRCTYETNCCCAYLFGNCIVSSSDKDYCDANPFYSNLDYRLGPPCEWYSHGELSGSCPGNKYRPVIETYWSYTLGSGFNSAIDLGVLTSGTSVSHFNSNICYSNNYPGSPGNDVFYQFTINNPLGVMASLCGALGAQFDSYIYIVNSDQSTVEVSNDNACASQSQASTFICTPGTYYIIVDATAPAELGTFTLQLSEDTSFVYAATINKQDISCFGEIDGTAKVDIVGGVSPYSISWDVSSSTNDSIFGLPAGIVTVTVTDDDNCTVTDMVTIIEPSPVSVTVTSTDVSCSGANDGTATASVSGGTPNPNFPPPNDYSYVWGTIPQQSLQSATLLGAGNYTVIVSDYNGCTATGTASISTSTQIIVSTDSLSDVSCFGNDDGYIDVSASGGVNPFAFQWSSGDTVSTLNNLPPGNYDLTVTDADNCYVVEFYTITEPNELELIVNNVFDATCYDEEDGVVDMSTLGGTYPYFYQWSNGFQTEDLINVFANGYTLSVVDDNNCLDTMSVVIDQPDSIEISFTSTDPSCFGEEDGSMSVSAIGGTPGYDITWSDFNPNPVRTNVAAGLYSVFVRDLNNCIAIDSVRLSTPPEILISDSVIGASCNGATDGAVLIDVNGGVPPYTFSWSDNSVDSNRENIPAGVYRLTVTDQQLCTAELTAVVEEQGVLYLNLVGNDARCYNEFNGSVTAVISGGLDPINYSWSLPAAPNSNVIRNLGEGMYTVTVTDASGCEAIDSVYISVPSELVLSIDTTIDATCYGDADGAAQMSASGGMPPYKFSVYTNDFQTSGSFSGLTAGQYGAIVADSNDCIVQESFTISENDLFEFSFEPIYYITRGSSITLDPNLAPVDKILEYTWQPADGLSCTDCRNPEASPLQTTNYTIIGVDEDGCIYEAKTSVYVKRDYEVFIPNAFSPNADNLNDILYLMDFGSTDNILFQIFNRSGELVFETKDIDEGWDGRFKGKLLDPAVFVYHLEGNYINGQEFEYNGSLTLLR